MPLTPEQLAFRLTGVSASEIGAVAGLSPYQSALDIWLIKRGLVTVEENRAMRMGHALEPIVADLYAADLDPAESLAMPDVVWPDSVNGTVRHSAHQWVLASPDRVVLRDGQPVRLVEIKSVSARMAHHWGEREDDVPAGYRAQIEWQMIATGIDNCDLVAWINGWDGPEVRTYRLTRDVGLSAMLLEIGRRFWACVEEGVEPPVDGSEAWKEHLKRRHPRVERDIATAAPEQEVLARELLDLKAEEKRIAARVETLENQMRAAIGAHEGMDGEGWRATWKAPSAGVPAWKTIAMKLGAEAQPELVAEHTAPPGRRFLISATKKRTT